MLGLGAEERRGGESRNVRCPGQLVSEAKWEEVEGRRAGGLKVGAPRVALSGPRANGSGTYRVVLHDFTLHTIHGQAQLPQVLLVLFDLLLVAQRLLLLGAVDLLWPAALQVKHALRDAGIERMSG